METSKQNFRKDNSQAREVNRYYLLILTGIALSMNSCSVVTGIFKAGMGFGIFIVVAVILGILFLLFRSGKK